MTKKPWQVATEGLVGKGLILPMPVVNRSHPKTVVGCPTHPFGPLARPQQDSPKDWDLHRYETVRAEELIKMPWRLIDGLDGMEPVLCELRTRGALIVLMTLYLVASGDGLIPNGLAHLTKGLEVEHRLGSQVAELSDSEIASAIGEILDVGLVYPACEDTRGRQVLRLFHPLEAASSRAA